MYCTCWPPVYATSAAHCATPAHAPAAPDALDEAAVEEEVVEPPPPDGGVPAHALTAGWRGERLRERGHGRVDGTLTGHPVALVARAARGVRGVVAGLGVGQRASRDKR